MQQTSNNRGSDFVVFPEFIHGYVNDLVCKGGSMYAFWNGSYWNMDRDGLTVEMDGEIREQSKKLRADNPGKTVATKLAVNDDSQVMSNF